MPPHLPSCCLLMPKHIVIIQHYSEMSSVCSHLDRSCTWTASQLAMKRTFYSVQAHSLMIRQMFRTYMQTHTELRRSSVHLCSDFVQHLGLLLRLIDPTYIDYTIIIASARKFASGANVVV